ncbi:MULTISPECIES: hypothetical protein [Sphingobacterium]|uniref:Uncharacterized protein n=1 Tax=Sphingobacterium ginsenosidimutans TaxID=687845 RepID=A0ABP8A3J6_9SPHI|nr:hypothetical protein [Sphingobacterium sp. E70]ULT24518.1 hypothetical protein KUH03_37090 [Sphingobacterium sp. E70]
MKPVVFIVIIIQLIFIARSLAQTKTYRTYYEHGNIQSITHQGIFMGCGVPVGTDSLFNRKGKLIETSTYVHIKDEKETGCHAITSYIEKTFYKSGNIKPVSQYYKVGYESEPVICDAKAYHAVREKTAPDNTE